MRLDAEVAVVGGGPAGAATAALLARSGRQVVILERSPAWRWRASGVFASPAAVAALRRIGLPDETVDRVSRPIPAMRVELPGVASARLTYGDDGSLAAPAVGFDRAVLDDALLDLARGSGVEVRRGVTVTTLDLSLGTALMTREGSRASSVRAGVVVGADGIRSAVARAAGVARKPRLGRRVGLTFHVRDPRSMVVPRDARMIVLDGAYCGLAPVPGGRLNVGIVLAGGRWRRALARDGAMRVAELVLGSIPAMPDDPVSWADAKLCDRIEGAAPLGHRVSRRAGRGHGGHGWLLVGDAAGFLDPFTGEGIHRALVSAELAAEAVDACLRGSTTALGAYDQAVSTRFRAKDVVSLFVQAFLGRPAAFGYALRRLAGREAVRETMGLVIGDLAPPTLALDPRFLAALLRP